MIVFTIISLILERINARLNPALSNNLKTELKLLLCPVFISAADVLNTNAGLSLLMA
jgi:hypothetical protein